MAFFNSKRFEKDSNTSPAYVRASDAYANKRGAYISFQHVPSKTSVKFKAFITTFNETYSSDWAPETVYGRIDPIYLFKNTTRKISLAFKIPAETESEALENLGRVQKLVQFLYPNYTRLPDASGAQSGVFAQTISQSPMVRIGVMNLLSDASLYTGEQPDPAGSKPNGFLDYKYYVEDKRDNPQLVGLLGVIDSLVVNHNLEGPDGVFNEGSGVVLPKMIDINIGFSPIHEHPIGWSDRKEASDKDTATTPSLPLNSMFPYAINTRDGPKAVTTQVPVNGQAMSGDGTDSLTPTDEGAQSPGSPQGTGPTHAPLTQAQQDQLGASALQAFEGATGNRGKTAAAAQREDLKEWADAAGSTTGGSAGGGILPTF